MFFALSSLFIIAAFCQGWKISNIPQKYEKILAYNGANNNLNDENYSLYKLANFNYTHVSVLAATARPDARSGKPGSGPNYCQLQRGNSPCLHWIKSTMLSSYLKQVARKTDLIAAHTPVPRHRSVPENRKFAGYRQLQGPRRVLQNQPAVRGGAREGRHCLLGGQPCAGRGAGRDPHGHQKRCLYAGRCPYYEGREHKAPRCRGRAGQGHLRRRPRPRRGAPAGDRHDLHSSL